MSYTSLDDGGSNYFQPPLECEQELKIREDALAQIVMDHNGLGMMTVSNTPNCGEQHFNIHKYVRRTHLSGDCFPN